MTIKCVYKVMVFGCIFSMAMVACDSETVACSSGTSMKSSTDNN